MVNHQAGGLGEPDVKNNGHHAQKSDDVVEATDPASVAQGIVEDHADIQDAQAENQKQQTNKSKSLLRIGPGIITGVADDDPSGIGTYSVAGAQFGYQLLWLAPVCVPLMIAVQEMCGRVALVTSKGLSAIIKEHYAVAETAGWRNGLYRRFSRAKGFYATITVVIVAGYLLNFVQVISPVKALLYSAVLNGLVAPPLIVVLLFICNNRKIVGKNANGWLSNTLGCLAVVLMSLAGRIFNLVAFHRKGWMIKSEDGLSLVHQHTLPLRYWVSDSRGCPLRTA